ncbi:MAG: Do family serine endopeptidase [Fibrobacteres bacterium]|nr:Do family serine endopeptidase [Fibrobacterota bacterium]
MRLVKLLSVSFLVLAVSASCADKSAKPDRSSLRLGNGPSVPKVSEVALALSDAFADVVDHVEPVVVSVYTSKTVTVQGGAAMPFPFFFGFPGEMEGVPAPQERHKQEGGGSGFIIDDRGYILTNAHVVKDQDEIKVELYDRLRFDATVVGVDEKADVAVLKIEPGKTKLQAAAFGNSDQVRIGQWVLALGNPYMFKNTVTAGIVSAKGRNEMQGEGYADHIQTDAAVNPGNSGGPLVNLKGEVIGINSSIWSRSGGYQGISFAIPINMARRIAEDLICDGTVSRGWLGLVIEDVDPELAEALRLPSRDGAKVVQVAPGSPSQTAGVKSGDVVLKVGDVVVRGSADLRNRVASERPGTKVRLRILRDGKELDVDVVLGRVGGELESMPLEAADGTFQLPRLGLRLGELDQKIRTENGLPAGVSGASIVAVVPGSPAHEKGLRAGMILVEILDAGRNSTMVKSASAASARLGQVKPGEIVALKVVSKEQVRLIGLRAREDKK